MKRTFFSLFSSVLFLVVFVQHSFAFFPDISEGKDSIAIEWFLSQGVISGYEDGSFRPDRSVNRAEFLKILYEAKGDIPPFALDGKQIFPDVPVQDWYAPYVRAAFGQGIIQGYPDGNFRPADYINRAEAMKILMKNIFPSGFPEKYGRFSLSEKSKIVGCEAHYLSDVEYNSWYASYFLFAHDSCLIPSYMVGDNTPPYDDLIFPEKFLTRKEMVDILYRAKAVSDHYDSTDSKNRFSDDMVPYPVQSNTQNSLYNTQNSPSLEDEESKMPLSSDVIFEVAINNYPDHGDISQTRNLAHVYVNVYDVEPVKSGVYEGRLVETIYVSESSNFASVRVEDGEIVNFAGFLSKDEAEEAAEFVFTTPPYKNFGNFDDKLCQINFLEVDEYLKNDPDYACANSLSTPYDS